MRVAIVVDDAVLGSILTDVVHERGHEALVFRTGEDAWIYLQREPCALLLVEWRLPGMDGLALCRRVRQLHGGHHAVLVVLTAHAHYEDVAAALEAGADDVLVTANEPDLLAARLAVAERQAAVRGAWRDAEAALQASAERLRVFFQENPVPMWVYDRQTLRILEVNAAALARYGYTRDEFLSLRITDLRPADSALPGDAVIPQGEWRHRRKDGRLLDVLIRSHTLTYDGRAARLIVAHDITARKQAEEHHRFQAQLLNAVGQAVIATDHNGAVTYWNRAAEQIYGWTAAQAVGRPAAEVTGGPSGQDWSGEQVCRHRDGHTFPALISTTPVFDQQGTIIGCVSVTTDLTEQKAAMAAVQRHLDRLAALRTIDLAITTSLDLRATLRVVLDQVLAQLGAHAAGVLLLDKHMQMLEYAAGRGFRGCPVPRLHLRLGEGHAGRAALERRLISAPDLTQEQVTRRRLVTEEGFVAYFAVPLIAHGQVQGVLEVFHRAPLHPNAEWLDYLETLAGQAAIAIHTATLFAEHERSTGELTLAYDTTIEGWSRALDLRDKETEGHSQRVTALSLALAGAMGLSDADLVHVRRGALLHDIGKMGIPDAILLKPGPLTEEEWAVMRRHPTYAYELLAPIAYLRPALDIPQYHHEKWDGSGYPHGLKGEQIPLAARIFAVADVWDALTSERPYRAAWPPERARAHLLSLSGRHFDPAVVETFLRLGLSEHPLEADRWREKR